jgi:hypothetical protein
VDGDEDSAADAEAEAGGAHAGDGDTTARPGTRSWGQEAPAPGTVAATGDPSRMAEATRDTTSAEDARRRVVRGIGR